MRINRVYLENYRVHEKLEIEFSKGINLLLGENGKGKSSILEAIGYTLFDSGLRTNNQKEAIKYGKKSAKIEVDFWGVDGEEYKVIRKIPGTTQLFKGDEVLEGRVEKIKELCGIKGDMKDIYDNVIVAKQNEFILAFKEKANEREKIFNRVFNTDIYTKIYEGYSREAAAKYEKELALVENSVANISETLLDSKEIEEKIEFLKSNLQIQQEYESLLEKKEAELKELLRDMRALEINIKQLEMMKTTSLQNIQSKKIEKEETLKSIDESIEAEEIVKNNQEGYEKYKTISDDLSQIKEKKKEIEKIREEYIKNEKKRALLESKLSQLIGEKEVLIGKKDNLEKNFNEKTLNEERLLVEKSQRENRALEYKEELEILFPILKYSLEIEEKLLLASQSIEKQKEKILEKKSEIESYTKEKKLLEEKNLSFRLEQLEILEKELRELEGKVKILHTQKNENKEAFSMLKSSICPYLKESCENLKGRDIGDFFNEKLNTIQLKIEEYDKKISQLQLQLKDKVKVQNEVYRYEELNKIVADRISTLEKEELKLETWEMKLQLNEREYVDYKKANNFSSSDDLKNLKISLETKLNTLEVEKISTELKNLEREKAEILKEKETLLISIDEIVEKERELKEEIETIKIYLYEKKEIENDFKLISLQLEKTENELKVLERFKELYIENYKKSLEKTRHLTNLKKIEEFLTNEEENFKKLEITLTLEKEKLSKYNKDELNRKSEELDEEFKNLKGKIGGIKSEISYEEERLLEAKKREERLKEEKKKIERLNLKIQLTKSFRDKIKIMGKEVAKNMLKEIELSATENFRKITGRGERVIWSNEDKDRYSVYLFGERGELKFEQLSGGEQVAVAISIRGAMSKIFTDSKFSIFDEPTNNLDSERRRSLADSIGEILKNLDQSIIVTHDDTFREMAERVIEL